MPSSICSWLGITKLFSWVETTRRNTGPYYSAWFRSLETWGCLVDGQTRGVSSPRGNAWVPALVRGQMMLPEGKHRSGEVPWRYIRAPDLAYNPLKKTQKCICIFVRWDTLLFIVILISTALKCTLNSFKRHHIFIIASRGIFLWLDTCV